MTAEGGLLLTITKAINPVPVAQNGRLTYTFQIENYGNNPAVATDNVVVADEFDLILTDLAVTFNGEPLSEGTQYTYNEATGLFTSRIGAITVPAATVTRDPVSGAFTIVPGVATLVVSGTV